MTCLNILVVRPWRGYVSRTNALAVWSNPNTKKATVTKDLKRRADGIVATSLTKRGSLRFLFFLWWNNLSYCQEMDLATCSFLLL